MHIHDEKQWLAFLDGEPAGEVERHLPNCRECTETARQLQFWQSALRQQGSRLCAAGMPDEAAIERMLDRCRTEVSRPWTPDQATLLLRALLDPLCGAGAAGIITDLARQRCQGTSGGWREFVGSLSEQVESICGLAAGRLIGRAGSSLSVEPA